MDNPGFGTKMWPLLLFLLALTPQSAAAPRDTRPSASATATISGRITDREPGRPIPGALINARGADSTDAVTARADGDGRYEISGLPPGEYTVWASPGELRATHLRQAFGRERPMVTFAAPPAPNLTLKAGDVRSDLDIALVRTLAIEGRVLDPRDEPMADVEVGVTRADGASVPAPSVFSNDRGEYRLFSLAPGRYHVCASPQSQFDSDSSSPTRFVRTCHLASILKSGAADIVLQSADVTGIDIRAQSSATYALVGTVLEGSGAGAENAWVSAVRDDREVSANSQTHEGRFALKGLTSGRYLVRATIGGPETPEDRRPAREPEAAEAFVVIDASDLANVGLTLSKGWRISGRIAFEGGPPLPPSQLRLSVGLARPADPWIDFRDQPVPVDDNLTFALKSLSFRPLLPCLLGLPSGWVLKSVRYEGRDVTDMVLDFTAATPQGRLQIVATNHVAWALVRVTDQQGQPVTSYKAILIPADPTRRLRYIVAEDPPSRVGILKLGPALPGDYLIAAIPPDDYYLLMQQPGRLDDLAALAQPVTLVEGKEHIFDMKLVILPPPR